MKKTKTFIAAIVAAGLIGTGIVGAENATDSATGTKTGSSEKTKLSHSDKKFIEEASQGGMAEVAMGQLGAEKAQSPELKQFAQKIVTDHQQANQQLMQIAQQKGVELEKEVSKKDQRAMEHLRGLSGAEFDKMYVEHMVKDHQKDIKAFEKEANKGEDSDIKSFAQQTLPKLREHLQTAETLAKSTGANVSEPAGAEKKQQEKDQQK
ncbi:MAG: outer membrane protein [Verrucomicrobiales bacterium]|nr:outer membrane protein [Verrucomicrobiales bacterium]